MIEWEQPDLFEPRPGIVGSEHPDTSRHAAVLVMPATGSQRRRVLDLVRARGELGATDLELQVCLELDGNSERPRRLELVEAGLVVDSGVRRAGRIVWVAAELDARDRHPTAR